MSTKDLFKTALGNLFRRPVRTVLSAVGVMVGILTIVTMLSLGVGVHRAFIQTFNDAGLEQVRLRPKTEEADPYLMFAEPRRTVLITPELVEEIRARDDVVEVYPQMYVPRTMNANLHIGSAREHVRVGETYYGLHDPFTPSIEVIAGREVELDAEGEIVVGSAVLESMGYEGQAAFERVIGREATLAVKAPRGDTEVFAFRIVGVVRTIQGMDSAFFGARVPVADAVTLKAWWYNDPDYLARQGYDVLTVRAATLGDAAEIVDLFKERGFSVDSLMEMLDTINKGMIVVKTMLTSVGGLALFVASIGIVNTMIMAVYERTKEIGILKAIGASPGQIRILFVVESALIGLLGGVAGTIGGWLLGLGLNEGIIAVFHWQEVPIEGTFFVVTAWLVALALAFATVVGLLAGLYPAARAAKLDPLEALRYE
jgi:ABC-type lipoprotein release transport system permease subunit